MSDNYVIALYTGVDNPDEDPFCQARTSNDVDPLYITRMCVIPIMCVITYRYMARYIYSCVTGTLPIAQGLGSRPR